MVEYFKTIAGRVVSIKDFEDGCWVNIVHPSSEELNQIFTQTGAEEDFIRAALDPEESSRVEIEEDQVLMIVDIPTVEKERENEEGTQIFGTLPMGIVILPNAVVTVCLQDTVVLRSIAEGAVKDIHTSMKTRFVFQILLRVAGRFLKNLRLIEHRLYQD